jgi:hypothetical protein
MNSCQPLKIIAQSSGALGRRTEPGEMQNDHESRSVLFMIDEAGGVEVRPQRELLLISQVGW